jgi:branched-chain amino acid transport system ATP-binding protein
MLEVSQVSVVFGGLRALDAVSLRVAPGARHALIGANGAGKSTLMHVAAGTVRPTSGRVILGGHDVTRTPAHRRARAGLARTFQQPALLRRHSAARNVTAAVWSRIGKDFALAVRPRQRRVVADEVEWLLDSVGLGRSGDHLAGELSHAQQRQLELAVALASRPRVLLLDEPAAGLAAPDVAELAKLIRTLPASLTILLVDHDLDLVFELADTVTVLDRGQHVMTGSPDEVRTDPRVNEVYLPPTDATVRRVPRTRRPSILDSLSS